MSTRQTLLRLAARLGFIAAAIGLALGASSAQALDAAGTDAVIRPSFGELLSPPIHHWRPHRPDWRDDQGYGWRGGHGDRYRGQWADPQWRQRQGYVSQGPIDTITVDCSDPALGPSPIADALDALSDGGTLYIRRSAKPCMETVLITRPVTIAGEPLSAFATPSPSDAGPMLAPPPGQPCIRIGPGVPAVEIRDLTLRDDQAGHSACIESWDSDLALTRIRIVYTGEASAIFMSNGRLLARETEIQALSFDPALTLEDVAVDFGRVRIAAASAGIDLSPTAGAPQFFDHVKIRGIAGADAASSPETGLMLRRSAGEASRVEVRNSRITGFKTGLWFQRSGQVGVHQTLIAGARVGVLSEDANLTITDSAIEARRTGIYVDGGRGEISHNRIYGFYALPIDSEPNTDLSVHENLIYPATDCRAYYARFDRWCRRAEELPDMFRDRGGDDGPDHWGWDGGRFDYPPPPPPPERHDWLWALFHDGHDHGHEGGDRYPH